MQAEATELNIGFMKRMREGLPWVRVKLAMSLDGRTALANGASQWITSESARADVQRWRARCSAVMTGVGTVLADDPQLNVRTPGFKGRQPLRVVLDARLRSPVGAKMFVGLGGGGSGAAGAAGAAGSAGGAAGRAGGVAGSPGGDVLIFTAVGGGLSAAGSTRSATPVDPSTLAGDLAELVNAFETSPTSVAARSADLAGPVSVKSETPASGVAAPTAAAAGATVSAGAPVGAAPAGSVGAGVATANAGAAAASAPPILAAATSAAGVAPTADDATWAGAALSGAVPVKSEAKTGTDGNGAAAVGSQVGGASGASTLGKVTLTQAPAATSSAAVSDVSAPPSMYGSLAPPMAAASKAAPIVTGEGPAATPATAAAAPGSVPGTAASVAHAVAPPEPAGTKPTLATAANGSASTTPGPAPAAHGSAPLARTPAPAGHGPAASGATAAPPAPPPAPVPLGANARAAAATPAPATTTTATPSASPAPGASTPAAAGANQRPAVQVTAPAVKPTPKPDSPAAFQTRRAALAARGVRIEEVAADEGFLDLFAVLKRLGELEVNEVLVEAGPTLAGQLLTTFFADELLLYIAPKLLGPQGRPLVNLPELQSLQDAWGFSLFDAKRFGDDLRLRMRPK